MTTDPPLKPKIAISGKMRTGKSTLARLLAKEFDIPIDSFAASLRAALRPFGLDENRAALQDVGTVITREDSYAFVRALSTRHPALHVAGLVIDDMRRFDEYKWAKQSGFTLIRLIAPHDERVRRGAEVERMYHTSEMGLSTLGLKWDHVLDSSQCSPEEMCELIAASIRENEVATV